MTDGAVPPQSVQPLRVVDPHVLILASDESDAASSNKRGALFESFVASLLNTYGYNEPTRESLNTTANGIELDVSAVHGLTNHRAIAECKAYSSPVPAHMLGTFHSKLVTGRYVDADLQGFFVAIPRLTGQGQEQAKLIEANDPRFRCLTGKNIYESLLERRSLVPCPVDLNLKSDDAVVISEDGIYAACIELDPGTRTPAQVYVWGSTGNVPERTKELLQAEDYCKSAPVQDARQPWAATPTSPSEAAPLIVQVAGSESDFEYQLPTSPKFFVGRKNVVQAMEKAVGEHAGVLVLNAQSGWGKSSAALRLKALAADQAGFALVVDSRTASSRRFVTEALSKAAQEAALVGVLDLPANASWASLPSSLRTLSEAEWKAGPLIVFFDQFENVFRDEALTREFRDLALSTRETAGNLMVGFAWKTDLVGWTEGHPYQLRDEIRSSATVLALGPFGASEVETLLRRLERELGQTLARDLRTRLREYSQGLPWLFKKLAGHLIREVEAGATQEKLASEALNVQGLFDADLAELNMQEQEAVRFIARHAPIAISEVIERVTPPVVESLVNRRLIVQVGERLDTYWDIFRDYLNTNRVPVEDSYILRQSPNSVARLLREVEIDNGDATVHDLAERLSTSENAVFNLSRELRLLGATSYEPNRVRLLPEVWEADDREEAIRKRVAQSIKRHRAFSAFLGIEERVGSVTVSAFASELPSAFPAIEVTTNTWNTYGRVFLRWFEYAGLATMKSQTLWVSAAEGAHGVGKLLGAPLRRRTVGGFPHAAPGPSIALLRELASNTAVDVPRRRSALRPLLDIDAVREEDGGRIVVQHQLVQHGELSAPVLRDLLSRVPGVSPGLSLLEQKPDASPMEVGTTVAEALSADWAPGTVHSLGKYLRAWARFAGVAIARPSRAPAH
ncbi:restriction endonuclease [Mycobacterium sp. shizuoka-1]|uniref:nSTAND1 domain-containing NTPase n=1 Tax=Mycobacterium sp. shizuoka-1 TaxID=2039281 RepID=UPI000C05DAF7|nr:restriction endonuclease [Mycobacterium sp. shizuoka-1]GAY15537.1 hypothetical protein MSZK_22630 [Mycobacterium sp. shizuoka-1]